MATLLTFLPYVGVFGVACLIGIVSYCALLLTRDGEQDFFLVLATFVVAIPSMLVFYVSIPVLFVMALLCLGPAFLERRMAHSTLYTWDWYFVRLFAATGQSVVAGLLVLSLFGSSLSHMWGSLDEDRSVLCLGAGLVLTPPAISVLRWLWHTSQLRPGLDREMRKEERDRDLPK